MGLQVIHDFRGSDSTKTLNDSVRDILPKGIYFGGKVVPGSDALQVMIEPFAAKSLDGQTVRSDSGYVTIDLPATGAQYYVGILAKYIPQAPSVCTPMAVEVSAFTNLPDKEYFISFGIVDLKGGNTIVVPGNITEAERDEPSYLQDQSTQISTITALYADALLSTGYEQLTFDSFDNSDLVDAGGTTMTYNTALRQFDASTAGQVLTTVDLLANITPKFATITEVMVFVASDDALLKVSTRASAGAPWVPAVPGTPLPLGASQGQSLYLQLTSGQARKSIFHYAILFKTIDSNTLQPGLSIIGNPGTGGDVSAVPPHHHAITDVDSLSAVLASIPRSFTDLLDTPSTLAGAGGRIVTVSEDGTALVFQSISVILNSNRWKKVAASYTAVAGDRIHPDNSAGPVQVTLPVNPVVGDEIQIRLPDGNVPWSTNNLAILRNGQNIQGQAKDKLVNSATAASISAEFIGGTVGWQVYNTGTIL